MRRCLTLAAAILATGLAAGAHAETAANGINQNGLSANGTSLNGTSINGINQNGWQTNGINQNGWQTNGINQNRLSANGTAAEGHDAPVTGLVVQAITLPSGLVLSGR